MIFADLDHLSNVFLTMGVNNYALKWNYNVAFVLNAFIA